MKVLLMSVKAGYGHHSTAQAIMDCFRDMSIECEMLDTFDYIDPLLCETIDRGYLFSTKNFPDMYGKAYSKLDKRVSPYKKYSFVGLISKFVSSKLRDYIADYAPDVIIATHSFAALVLTYMKHKGLIDMPTFGIVTDFTVHPFWESTDIDYYVTPDKLLNNQMRKKGIPEEKILPFGIPINRKFLKKQTKQEAREALGIGDKRTILLMMGSMGFGNIEKQLEAICDIDVDMQVLCVCGKNEKIKKEIDSHDEWKDKIITYGFVDNVDVMMDASDCIITKPGGLTTSELLAKRLPAIIMNPIPGQEDRNMEFLVNNGAAISVSETYGLDEALYGLFSNSTRLRLLKVAVSRLGKPNSTRTLCEFVQNEVNSKRGH
ncbi:MAG: glycosyltransferase [Clostridia bacterium]|nr:glycosyltransferase [Clostridia bacterium]